MYAIVDMVNMLSDNNNKEVWLITDPSLFKEFANSLTPSKYVLFEAKLTTQDLESVVKDAFKNRKLECLRTVACYNTLNV